MPRKGTSVESRVQCPDCDYIAKGNAGIASHRRMKHDIEPPAPQAESVAEAATPAVAVAEPLKRSEKGRSKRDVQTLTPFQQIPMPPSKETTGAGAYYVRQDGATITDALTWYPNGGIPNIDDERMKARYATNAEYYRQRQAKRGHEYVGPTLTEGGIRTLIATLERNRPDEILFIEEEIEDAEIAKGSDIPEVRNQARKRIGQLSKRLNTLHQPIDADELESKLKEIAQAQELSRVNPAILRVMKTMIGDSAKAQAADMALELQGLSAKGSESSTTHGAEFEGQDSLERD